MSRPTAYDWQLEETKSSLGVILRPVAHVKIRSYNYTCLHQRYNLHDGPGSVIPYEEKEKEQTKK